MYGQYLFSGGSPVRTKKATTGVVRPRGRPSWPRPARPATMRPMMRIGVDLGGTKIEAAALDESGTVLVRRRVPAPRGDYEASLRAVSELVAAVEREAGCEGTVGVGHPGSISPSTGLVRNANSTWLNDRPLDRDLARVLGREVRTANDANCFALSEAHDGAAAGRRVVFGVILGTGCGGGIVFDGKVHAGPNAIAGEWGHNPIPWPRDDERPGPPCHCGRSGCVETFVCGPALARDYREATGGTLAATEIATRARAGDARAREAMERHAERLARSLALLVNLLDPDAIVIGGGLSNMPSLYDRVPVLWQRFVVADRVDTPLLRARHGDSSGVRGAAWLWK